MVDDAHSSKEKHAATSGVLMIRENRKTGFIFALKELQNSGQPVGSPGLNVETWE
jgi:hypothetical protein